jgi:SAM-dependent methyltransferase
MQQLVDHKQAARETWATGDYDAMMRQERLYEVGASLVSRLGLGLQDSVLDVACGTGNATIPAARTGAQVTGVDLTPRMLEVADERARAAGVQVRWLEGDMEALPFDDDHFDVVVSTFGCQFAARHEVVADELARVLRPGGRLGLCTWTPEGSIGDFFRTVGAHLPPPPPFVDPPLRWGEEDHVRSLFEGTGLDLGFERATWDISHDSVDAAVECYTTTFGPVVQARRRAEAEGTWPQLQEDLRALFERHDTGDGERLVFPAEYLVVLGTSEAAGLGT